MTKAHIRKLEGIIGRLEALQHQVGPNVPQKIKDRMMTAKSDLIEALICAENK